jgi:hypothetical protein
MDLESLKKPLKDLFEENATVQVLLLSSYYSILLREVYDYLTQWGYVNLSFQVPEYRRAMGPLYKRYSRGCELVMRHLDQPTQGPKNFGNICVDWQARKITVLSQDDPHIVQMNSLTRWMFDQEEEVIEGPLIFPFHIKRGEMVKGLVNQKEFPYGRRPVKMMEMDSV